MASILRCVPQLARAAQAPRAAAPRFFSSDLTPEQMEDSAILESMARLVEKSNMVCSAGPNTFVPDLPHNLPANVAEVATLDHTPKHVTSRTVVIGQEAIHAMTSGNEKTKGWHLQWKHIEKWSNPLTGWTSSADPMTTVKLTFDTKQQAIDFATKKGLNYEVKERPPRQRSYGTNYYAHNFLPAAYESRLQKEGSSTKLFVNPNKDKSNYFRPLSFHGSGPCRQHGSAQNNDSML